MEKSFDHWELIWWGECSCCCFTRISILPRSMPQFRSATKHDHFDGLLIFFLSYFIIICGWSLWHISEEYFSILILNWLSVQLSHTIRRLHKTFYGERDDYHWSQPKRCSSNVISPFAFVWRFNMTHQILLRKLKLICDVVCLKYDIFSIRCSNWYIRTEKQCHSEISGKKLWNENYFNI